MLLGACVRRRLHITLGLCFLAVVSVFGPYRAGLLRKRSDRSVVVANASPAPAPNTAQINPLKVAESPFPLSPSDLDDTDADTFIALRYDATHVLFRLGEKGDFSLDDPKQEKTFHPLANPVTDGAGQPFELEPAVFESVKQHYEPLHVGEQWQLETFAGVRLPVTIQKPVEMSWGCTNNSFTAGFIAEVAPEFQEAFSTIPHRYFLVHKSSTPWSLKPHANSPRARESADWSPAPDVRVHIEEFVTATLKDEIDRKHGAWWASTSNSGQDPRAKQAAESWGPFIEKTASGQGKLIYDMKAVVLSPDGVTRLYVRAMWKTGEDRAFLMSRWLRLGPSIAVESSELDGTRTMWEEKDAGESVALELSSLPSVLNVFDRPDGYGDVLIYSPGYEGYSIVLYHYGNAGLGATNISMGDGC